MGEALRWSPHGDFLSLSKYGLEGEAGESLGGYFCEGAAPTLIRAKPTLGVSEKKRRAGRGSADPC